MPTLQTTYSSKPNTALIIGLRVGYVSPMAYEARRALNPVSTKSGAPHSVPNSARLVASKHPAAHPGEHLRWGVEVRSIETFEQP